MLLTDVFWFAIACLVLIKSAGFVVKSLAKLAVSLRLTEFILGFVIVAVSTSLPELFVGITSSLKGIGELAIGNVIGANINDIALIMGISVLIGKKIKIDMSTIRDDLWYMLIIAVLPVILLMDHKLSRVDGAALICVFLIYMWTIVSQRRIFHKVAKNHEKKNLKSIFINISFFFVGIALLLISSRFVVKYASNISADLSIPPLLVGLFMVSVGTTLPELVFSYKAVLSKREGLLVGDLVGSVIVNSSLVLGTAALINPLTAPFTHFIISAFFMLALIFVFITFAESKGRLTQKEGLALIVLYIFFVIIEFYMKGVIK